MRRILIIIILIFAAGGVLYLFQQIRHANSPLSEAINAVPEDAAFILESRQIRSIWQQLDNTNLIWQELQQTPSFRFLDFSARMLDSLIEKEPDLKTLFSSRPLIASAHPTGANDYNFLFCTTVPPTHSSEKIRDIINGSLGEVAAFSEKTYEDDVIYSVQLTDQYSFHYAFPSGILVFSFSPILIEDAIRQSHRENNSLAETYSLKKLRKTTSINADANLYIHQRNFNKILAGKLSNDAKSVGFFKSPLATWSAFDVYLKTNAVLMNGFSLAGDSTSQFLDVFKNQSPQDLTLTKWMPANTAFFNWYAWSDLQQMRRNYNEFLEKENRLFSFQRNLQETQDHCQCDIEDLLLSWVGNQAASVVTEPTSLEYSQNRFLLFETANEDLAKEKLQELERTFQQATNQKPDTFIYRGFRIGQVISIDLHRAVFNDAFRGMLNPYFAIIDQAVVFANSANALRVFINAYLAGNTLHKDKSFTNFRENLSNRSNIILYSSLARSPFIYENLLTKELSESISKDRDLLRKFEAVVFQFSYHRNDLFYSNIYFKHNPVYKQETTSLWEIDLDGRLTGNPWIVTNHNTGAREIFIQDSNNKLYLISNTGNVLWERQLEEPILGEVKQIDLFRNKKLQLLFNTTQKIYLIDRTGKDVSGYPVQIPGAATAGAGIFDYDNSRDYRILVPTENRSLFMIDGRGKKIQDWAGAKTAAISNHPPQHIRIKGKDYIFATDIEGNVYLLDRQSNIRHKVKEKLIKPSGQQMVITTGESISSSFLNYLDTLGNIHKLYFDGSGDEQIVTGFKNPAVTIRDVSGDGKRDFILAGENRLKVIDHRGDEIFEQHYQSEIKTPVQFFILPDGQIRIAVVLPEEESVYLLDQEGKVAEGFPLYGSTSIAVSDINNDGNLNLIIGNRDGSLYTYGLK